MIMVFLIQHHYLMSRFVLLVVIANVFIVMLFNDIDHSMSLHDTLMVFSDDRTHVRNSFKTTIFVY